MHGTSNDKWTDFDIMYHNSNKPLKTYEDSSLFTLQGRTFLHNDRKNFG